VLIAQREQTRIKTAAWLKRTMTVRHQRESTPDGAQYLYGAEHGRWQRRWRRHGVLCLCRASDIAVAFTGKRGTVVLAAGVTRQTSGDGATK